MVNYLSLKIEKEMLAKMLYAVMRNEDLGITLSFNKAKELNPSAPDYIGNNCAVWVRESKFGDGNGK